MRLTKGVAYGARGIIHLAKLPESSVALVADIASSEGLPESYLAKIFQDLAKEGLVRSYRGAKGGFSLGRPACDITLRQVIEAIDGPIALCRCLAPFEGCDKIDTCAMSPVFAKAQRELIGCLDSTSVADLATHENAFENAQDQPTMEATD